MKRAAFALGVLGLAGGCTSLLGTFQIASTDDGGGQDGATEAALDGSVDAPPPKDGPYDAPKDVVSESPPPPTCGVVGAQCCATSSPCLLGAQCCGGICADTTKDAKNCGTCGHDCKGALCQGSVCQPTTLNSLSGNQAGRIRMTKTDVAWLANDLSNVAYVATCSKATNCVQATVLFQMTMSRDDLALDPPNSIVYGSDGSTTLFECPIGGCNQLPQKVTMAVQNGFDGIDARGDVFASLDIQPQELHPDGTGLLDLGDGNEGSNSIVAPPGLPYVYWNAFQRIRVGKAGAAASYSDFWTGNNENTGLLAADSNWVVWVGQGAQTTIWSCNASASCSSANALATVQNLGYAEGTLWIDPVSDDVFWATMDATASHVQIFTCPAAGCSQKPMLVTSASAKAAGAVASDGMFVYFDYDTTSNTVVLASVPR